MNACFACAQTMTRRKQIKTQAEFTSQAPRPLERSSALLGLKKGFVPPLRILDNRPTPRFRARRYATRPARARVGENTQHKVPTSRLARHVTAVLPWASCLLSVLIAAFKALHCERRPCARWLGCRELRTICGAARWRVAWCVAATRF